MTAYYNEIEPYAAEWLRNLIAEGLIAPGDVDEHLTGRATWRSGKRRHPLRGWESAAH